MLQSLRENLKGTVAVFVLIIFVVPLVLFGVEQLFVGSVGGTDAATVNGEGINKRDLQREIMLEKQRLQQQLDLEANSPRLEDSALTGPVLKKMVQREALLQAAVAGGMGASKDELWRQIAQIEAFQVDGKFDYELFKERISNVYTPAKFLDVSARDFILGHLNAGIVNSSFVTNSELALLAAITQQQRTFFSIEIPKSEAQSIEVTDEELQAFYADNSAQYLNPEQVSVEYIELSLDQLAEQTDVSESEIQAVYDAEVKDFKAEPKYVVAHILLEKNDGQADKLAEIEKKIAAGEDFAQLAADFSDDLGSKSQGGKLGEMIEDAYPESFVSAVKTLEVGAVSSAVVTDSGTHFIKLLEKSNVTPSSYAERKDSIKRQLARELAQEEYILKVKDLDEKTFGADSLSYAAEDLGVKVKTSPTFTRRGGAGIAADKTVVNAAFADDVLKQGHNSPVLELGGDRSVVVRLHTHNPEQLKPFDSVKAQIKQRLVNDKQAEMLAAKAQALIAKLQASSDYESVAKESGLAFKLYEAASRSKFDGNTAILQKVFSLGRPDGTSPVIDQVPLPGAGVAVVGLLSVENGKLESLEKAQADGIKRQLGFQLNQAEMGAFEAGIIKSASIDMPE